MPIRLIAGLGNPGREHERDRHNAGFWLAERVVEHHRAALRMESKYHALTARVALPGGDVWIVLPQTYMNLSGKAVAPLAHFYKIAPAELLVLHDELDFEPGVVKLKLGGGVGGHNGLKDIAAALGSREFWRLRIGIGHPGNKADVPNYVLSSPPSVERLAILGALDRSMEALPLIMEGRMEAAMLKLHTRSEKGSTP